MTESQSFADLSAEPVWAVVLPSAGWDTMHHRPPPVPEPATWLLLACGLIVVFLMRRRRG